VLLPLALPGGCEPDADLGLVLAAKRDVQVLRVLLVLMLELCSKLVVTLHRRRYLAGGRLHRMHRAGHVIDSIRLYRRLLSPYGRKIVRHKLCDGRIFCLLCFAMLLSFTSGKHTPHIRSISYLIVIEHLLSV
jgi:hypothetical protein